MKKVLPVLSLILLLFAACKKSDNSEAEPKEEDKPKYDVSFTVADFAQTVGTLSTGNSKATTAVGDTLKNYVNYLYYRIYNSAGVLVNSVDQEGSLSTFGTITDKLPSGAYNVLFTAGKYNLFIPGAQTIFSNASFGPTYGTPWNDTFVKHVQLTVGSTAIAQSVRLDRVIGGLEVVLQDAIPSNVAKVSVVFQSDVDYIYSTGTGTFSSKPITRDFSIAASDIGQKNKKFLSYIGNTVSASSVIIRAYDSANGLLAEKTVSNVRCYKNQKTTLTGTLFPATSSASLGFTVTVNPTWGASGGTINF